METKKQSETIASESFKKDNGRKGFKIRAVRHPKEGLNLIMNSSVDFDIFKRRDGKKITIGGVSCVLPRQQDYPGIECPFVSDSNWEFDGVPNLTLILAEGIREGVTFSLGVFPISEEKITNYLQKMKESVSRLYLGHCKELDVTCNITFETIQREIHY
jgi:hypothetical protein